VEILGRVHTFRFDVHVGYMRDAGDYHRRGGHLAEDTDDRTWEMEGIAMNESDCKLITEKLLGEKYHKITTELDPDSDGWMWSTCVCGDKWSDHSIDKRHRNRTFTAPQDFFACFEKMKVREDWHTFKHFVWENWCRAVENDETEEQGDDYILSRTESGHYRLCVLCAEWLRKENKDGHQ
jgi:hypothetical protein